MGVEKNVENLGFEERKSGIKIRTIPEGVVEIFPKEDLGKESYKDSGNKQSLTLRDKQNRKSVFFFIILIW